MLRWLQVGVVFAAVLLSVHEAAAQAASKEPPAGYTVVLRDALAEADAQNWPEAKTLFEKAHAMFPNARTLRGLGMVAYAARRYVDALEYLTGALEHAVRPLTADQRAAAQNLVEQCQTFVAKFEVKLEPADAQLFVDGQPAQLDESHSMLVDPGEHELVVRAPEYVEVARRLLVKGGEHGVLELTLQPLVTEVAAQPAAPAPVKAAEPAPERPAGPRLWTWVAAGSAVAFGAASIAIYMSGVSESNEIKETCEAMPMQVCSEPERDKLIDDSGIHTKETLATVGWIVAGASLATAAVLFFVEGQPASQESAPAPAPVAIGISPAGVALSGRF